MAKVLSRLDILLFANTAQYRSEMRNTQQETGTLFQAMAKDAKEMAKVGAVALTGLAVAGGAMAAAMVKDQIVMASELSQVARIAGATTKEIQVMALATKSLGIEQDALGDMYKDFNEKVGEFLSNGGGGMVDFFETIAPRVGATAEEFRGLSGPEGLQLYINYLEKANLTQGEMSFYLESMASDTTALIAVLQNGGAAIDLYAAAAENAGVIMDAKTIRATQELDASMELLTLSAQGAQNQFVRGFIPVLADVATKLTGTENASDAAYIAGQNLAIGFKAVAMVGIGVSAVFDAVGSSIGGVAAIIGTLMEGVNFWDGGIMIAVKMAKNLKAAGDVNRMVDEDIRASLMRYGDLLNSVKTLGDGGGNSVINGLIKQKETQAKLRSELGQTGAAYLEQAEAIDKHTAAMQKAQSVAGKANGMQINTKSAKNAEKYNFAALESQYGLPYGLLSGVHMQESRGNSGAVGPATRYGTAKGGFQFIDDTAKRYGVNDPFNMVQASEGAAKYLKFLLNKFNGDIAKAVAAYNTGEGNVEKHGLGLILSDRWARNKKTGVGQTKEYTKNVLGYMATVRSVMGETSQLIYESGANDARVMQQQAEEQQRIQTQQAQSRKQIMMQYADDAMRVEIKLFDELSQIATAGFEPQAEYRYADAAIEIANQQLADIERNKQAYINAQAQKLAAFTDFKSTESETIERNARNQRQAVLLDKTLSDQSRQIALAAIDERADLERAELKLLLDTRHTAAADFRQTELGRIRNQYEYERRELLLNLRLTEQQRSEYAALLDASEQNAINDAKKDAGSAFQDLTTGLNGTGEMNAIGIERENQLEIVQNALDAEVIMFEQASQTKLAIEMAFYESRRQLITGQMESVAGSLASITGDLAGKQSTAFRVMFAVEKGFAIARSVMAIQTGIAQAASLPFPANLPAMASVAAATANILSNIQAVRQPAVAGQAHDGLDYVPREGTYILDAGERVVKPRDNQRLTKFLDEQTTKAPASNAGDMRVIVNNYTDTEVMTTRNSDGDLELKIVNAINKHVPAQLSNPSSAIGKSLKGGWNVSPRR